ncbi:MAG: amidase [Acidovorax sp.]|nr:amidase [Acidovorax sp.]
MTYASLSPSSPSSLRSAPEQVLTEIALQDSQLRAWAYLAREPVFSPPAHGALAGLHFGVKDVLDVAGMPTLCGSPLPVPVPQARDAQCVARLRQAGATPIGKTVTAEFAHVTPGPTCNPHRYEHTPGGSSSGSAAAVAAGMVPFALGTQTGGSMIRPAAYCGVPGFKPSYGRVSREGMRVMCPSLDAIGWFARDMPMVRRVAQVLLSANDAAPAPKAMPRIAVLHEHPGFALAPDARRVLDTAAANLQRHGHGLDTAQPPATTQQLITTHSVLVRHEMALQLQHLTPSQRRHLSPALQTTVQQGQAIATELYQSSLQWQAQERSAWCRYFGDADLVLTTGAIGAAPQGLAHTGESGFNKGWSVLGWPCLHLPTGWSDNGLPLGVMLVARPGWDHALLAWAEALHPLMDRRAKTSAIAPATASAIASASASATTSS